MILIFSYSGDLSTDYVIDWLNFYKHPVYRLNSDDFYDSDISVDIKKNEILINGNTLPLKLINAVWFRKFGLKKDFKLLNNKSIDSKHLFQLCDENYIMFDLITYLLKNKKWLTNPDKSRLNKGIVLKEAQLCGLNIPNTIFTNNKNDIINLKSNCKELIFKSTFDPIFFEEDKICYSMYTKKLSNNLLDYYMPDKFGFTIIQDLIDKKYEIRSFYLNGKFYSMAIFSQDDNQTKIDFRNYNMQKPNRTMPYVLPRDIVAKLNLLLKKLGLNCASIDLLRNIDGEYIFLEINPVGQFGMVDFPCNYGIHKKIALELIQFDKNETTLTTKCRKG